MTCAPVETEADTPAIAALRALLDMIERLGQEPMNDAAAAKMALLRQTAVTLARRIMSLERNNHRLEERLALLLKRLYGRRSEKSDPNQLLLFGDDDAGPAPDAGEDGQTIEVAGHKRAAKGHGRDSFPGHLPRNRIELEPGESERICATCSDPLCRIGEDVSEKGEYIPGRWEVNQYVRGKWACPKGHGGVVMAPPAPGVVERSRFEPSVYALAATSKYADHLPIGRQSGIQSRVGISISTSTLCDMMRDLACLLSPILLEMKAQVLASRVIQTDDTPVDVLVDRDDGGGKRVKVKGRIWVYLALDGKVVFDFTLSRSRDGPKSFLGDFAGYLQSDAYAGYDEICSRPAVVRLGCWAHVRRKFKDALIADRKRSGRAIRLIGWLYRIESLLARRRAMDPDYGDARMLEARKRLAHRVLGKIKSYLESLRASPDVLPGSLVGVAVGYALNQWEDIVRYPDDLDLSPDNNGAERALRGIAVGRKNYLFFGSPRGGDTAAVLYSLMGTCKALKIDPYAYLKDVLTRLVNDRSIPPRDLTPWAWRDAFAARVAAEVIASRPEPAAAAR